MDDRYRHISRVAREAIQKRNWPVVHQGADELIKHYPKDPEGHFLLGLVEKASQGPRRASDCFEQALKLDATRYDAAIELADQYVNAMRNSEAVALLRDYEEHLSNSPRYLDMAATIYTTLGMSEQAWPLYLKANELQPDIDLFKANLASCAVYVGQIEKAEEIYRSLLEKHPQHQRNHYHISRLRTVTSTAHIEEMLAILDQTQAPPERNVFLYYALGKEYEDLEEWDNAFKYYKAGADAISSVANYDIEQDLSIIDAIIDSCDAEWLSQPIQTERTQSTPIFVLGLPRTGSTLVERIISNHSEVVSIGETQHLESLIRLKSGLGSQERMNADMIVAAANEDQSSLAKDYYDAIKYQVADSPLFLEKMPYNFLYAGFIAKTFPEAKIVYVKRNPLDACFAMYKQVFTWAYKFSYRLADLATYYIAHIRLLEHYQSVLGSRLITVEYERMVENQEQETRDLLDLLGLPFEAQCLDFANNQAASTTASSVQVRQPIHARSIEKWTHFKSDLEPLRQRLEAAGIRC